MSAESSIEALWRCFDMINGLIYLLSWPISPSAYSLSCAKHLDSASDCWTMFDGRIVHPEDVLFPHVLITEDGP